MNTTKILAKLSLAAASTTMFSLVTMEMAQAAVIVLDFEGLQNNEPVNNFYSIMAVLEVTVWTWS